MGLVLAGCGAPEVSACEDFIKDGLKSPSSYQRASVETNVEPTTLDGFREASGRPMTGSIYEGYYKHHKVALRNVVIKYDAQNAYGTPVREVGICAFELTDGELRKTKGELHAAVLSAIAARSFRDMANRGAFDGIEPGSLEGPKYPCCL